MKLKKNLNLNTEIQNSTRETLSELSPNNLSQFGYCRLFRKNSIGNVEYGKISIVEIFYENFTIVDPQSFQSWHYDSLEELLEDGWVEKL